MCNLQATQARAIADVTETRIMTLTGITPHLPFEKLDEVVVTVVITDVVTVVITAVVS